MKSLWHWLTELGEVYARHADRHGPNRLREEIHLLEMPMCYWQARLQHMPGSSDPGTPRDQIQHMIDLVHQELGLKRPLESF